jgi:hypothetical protein
MLKSSSLSISSRSGAPPGARRHRVSERFITASSVVKKTVLLSAAHSRLVTRSASGPSTWPVARFLRKSLYCRKPVSSVVKSNHSALSDTFMSPRLM